MGCNNSKVDPTYESNARHLDYSGDGGHRTGGESVLSQKTLAADDAIIAKLKSPTDHIDVQAIDPQAFNNSLIQQRQQAIDNPSYRSEIESCQPKSLQQLVDTLRTLAEGKHRVDRHWLIFYWITRNIAYDTVSYFSGKFEEQSAEGVFRTKKGVCAGYANLYKYLSNQLQMPCEVVNGYSKGYGFEYRVNPPARTDHAWNAVEIDGHWYITESTWGSGHLNSQNAFEMKLGSYYFLPRPNEMIYHHMPEKSKWQLLRTEVTLDDFMQLPHHRPLYFELKIELISPRNQVHISLLPGKSYTLVLLRTPPDVHLIASLKLKDSDIDGSHHVMFDKGKQLYRCYFAPRNAGKHKAIIFARKGLSAEGEYDSILDFVLDVKQVPNNVVTFPKTWKNFTDLGLEIISPLNTHLITLNNDINQAQIQIKTSDKIELLGRLKTEKDEDVPNADHVYYDQQKRLWQCDFAPDRSGLFEAQIMARKKGDPGNYTSAVTFKIDATKLTAPPVSFPYTWPLFRELGLKIEAPKNRANAVWPNNASYAEVLIQAPKDIELSCQITQNDVSIENGTLAQFDSEKKLWQLLFAPERTGLHELIVYAKRASNTEAVGDAVVKFGLDVTKLQRPMKFPMIYSQFQTKKCRIYTPLDGIVKKGSVIPIYCSVPGAIDVTVAVDSKMLESGGYSNPVFQREVVAGSKAVLVCANYGQKTGYSGLFQYNVR